MKPGDSHIVRTCNHAAWKTHFLLMDFETEINLLDFNPDYPKDPQTFGELLRKVRMDKGMTIKEVAALIGVTDTAIINWEIRG